MIINETLHFQINAIIIHSSFVKLDVFTIRQHLTRKRKKEIGF